MTQKGGFKNIKLGKNVHRQLKRRGAPSYAPVKKQSPGRKQGGRHSP